MMLSPFTKYAELDGRRDLDGGLAGRFADAYDDAPHHLAIWRRVDALSFPSTRDPGLNEVNAGAMRIEIVTENDARRRAELVATWKDVASALAQQNFPLAAVVYENRFVGGQLVWVWLAKDSATLKAAPSIKTAITWAAGDRRARDLTVRINQLTGMDRYFSLKRRDDLSTVPP
jgi:hypothetical protein